MAEVSLPSVRFVTQALLDDRQRRAADRRRFRRVRRRLQHRQLLRRHRDDAASGLSDRLRGRRVGLRDHQRRTVIGVLAQRLGEWHLAQQRHVELVGEQLAAALAEDREALAVGRREAGHVLDHAEDLEVALLRHLGAALGDRLGRGLRRGDDHELGLRQQLGERHRDVAGPRRQVQQQVLELVPGDVLEELLDRLVPHRAAPDDGGVVLDEEADRHHLHPAGGVQRQDLALGVDLGFVVDTEHARDRVAVDVAVERPGRVAFGGQRRGQVGGHRRLSDPALAGGDADHVFHLRQRALRQLAAAERLLQLAFLLVGEDVEADRDGGHAFELGDLAGDGLFEVGADRAAGGGQRDHDLYPAVLLDLNRADHAQLDDRAPQLGVDDGAQLLGYLILGGKRHWLDSRKGPIPAAVRRQGGEFGSPVPWSPGTQSSEGGTDGWIEIGTGARDRTGHPAGDERDAAGGREGGGRQVRGGAVRLVRGGRRRL